MDLRDREWRLVPEECRPGPVTMALEEVAARRAAEDGVGTVRVYTWPDVLSLGYRQPADTVDWSFCADAGIDVTRRQTGGGGIYHDSHADVSYGIVAPADDLPGRLVDSYRALCEPLLAALDALGLDADYADRDLSAVHSPACYLRSVHPAHDVLVDGRKVSGNAQYRQREAVIQHGSLSVDLAVDRHLGVFGCPVSPERFRERVTSVRNHADVDRERVVAALEDALAAFVGAERRPWTDAELREARTLAREKYDSDAWVRDRRAPAD
jgi:lipoate-protein ligase A